MYSILETYNGRAWPPCNCVLPPEYDVYVRMRIEALVECRKLCFARILSSRPARVLRGDLRAIDSDVFDFLRQKKWLGMAVNNRSFGHYLLFSTEPLFEIDAVAPGLLAMATCSGNDERISLSDCVSCGSRIAGDWRVGSRMPHIVEYCSSIAMEWGCRGVCCGMQFGSAGKILPMESSPD